MIAPLILASELSQVPPEFLKWFVVCMLAFAGAGGGLWFGYRRGMRASGTKDEPVNIAMPIDVRQLPEVAHKAEVEALRNEIAAERRAGAERRVEILNALHGMEQRTQGTILQECKTLHERLNPIVGKVEAHGAQLNHINADNLRQTSEISAIRRSIEELLRTTRRKAGA